MAISASEIGGQIISKVLGGILWFGVAMLFMGVIGGLMWYYIIYKKKFDIRIKIKSDRAGGQQSVHIDYGAILTEASTGTKYLRLWQQKVDLPVPKFEVLQKTSSGDEIEIWRRAEDDFVFLRPATINQEVIIKSDGKEYPIAFQEHKQIDADIAYWSVKRKKINKGMFDQDSILMKLLPFLPQIFGGVIMIFILYILLDNLPGILAEMKALVTELQALKSIDVITYN